MNVTHFLPWIGRHYTQGISGLKVMALGESHYCGRPEDDVPSITNDVLKCYLNPSYEFEGWMNTYTKFIRALSGDYTISRETSAEWWDRILFYNFVQVPMTGPRQAPTEQEFRASDASFFEVLSNYRPDIIIAWGSRLYDNLPNKGYQGPDLRLPNGTSTETWIYEHPDGHKVHVLPITHPSAGFDTEFWHKAIEDFINRIS